MVLRHRTPKVWLLMLIYSIPALLFVLVTSWARW
jgi:hypothetical protein